MERKGRTKWKDEVEEEVLTEIEGDVVDQIEPCPKSSHRPKLGDHRWYGLKTLLT